MPRKHYFARIPTIALFLLFALSPGLGVAGFILRWIDRDLLKQELRDAQHTADFRAQPIPTIEADDPEPSLYGHDLPTAEQKSAKRWHKNITNLCMIFGALFLAIGLTSLGDGVYDVTHFWDWSELVRSLAQTIGGGGVLWLGLRMRKARKLERLLDKIVGERDNVALDELFAAAGVSTQDGLTAVENAISHGYFGADAYIDHRTHTLVVRGAAPEPPQPQAEPAAEDIYTSLLRQLREVNDAIPDPVMSAKIARLEELSARIFALAQKDEAKKAQLQKFMDYYLPTALKLLRTYAQLPAEEVQGEHISDARQSIERSMDLLVTAFENQLDKLFAADSLDVSADIAALEGMLGMDGLTESDFSR